MVGFAHTRFLVHHTFLSDGVICEIDHRVGILSRPFPLQRQIEICRVRRFPTYRTRSVVRAAKGCSCSAYILQIVIARALARGKLDLLPEKSRYVGHACLTYHRMTLDIISSRVRIVKQLTRASAVPYRSH